MNIRTLTTVAASLVVISGLVTTNLWRELRLEREAGAALRAGLADSRERIRIAEERAAAAAAAARVVISSAVPAPTPAPERKPETSVVRSSGAAVFTSIGGTTTSISEQDLMKDPDYRKARLLMLRTSLRQTYPGLTEELGLSPDEADQLFELLAQNQMEQSSQLSFRLNGDQQVDQAAMAEVNRSRQALQRELNDSLQAMLGGSRYRQWQDYQQTRSQRMQVNNYANTMAQAGVPMNTSQNKAMVQVMIAEQRSLQMDTVQLGRMVDPSNPQTREQAQQALSNRRAESNQRILDAAAGTLTPQQVSVLREQFEQQEAVNRAQERVQQRTEMLRLQQQ